ncbi:hypothetical protein HNQ91_000466 [Filimonas zeae]|uniref:beta-galactosidase n=1 Tax=Filimonas zeae TaxID=1737353 RepID=UPI001662B7BC|nr:beta-galactosidase [Filimonas zeae]MDR6337444.1 hypothetical protein [Filimonas zeae]
MKSFWLPALLPLLFLRTEATAQHVYEIDAAVPEVNIYSHHLKLGGSSAAGSSITVNNYYISVDGKPMVPVTGEFHFTRYPRMYWEESIEKMKAGGINVIATYVFWNLHEEKEGVFAWEGDKDLRYFMELCKKHNIYAIVRVGPFCHGEIRSGGLPDWLLGSPLNIRSDDSLYLSYVERLYNQIGMQLQGLYYKNDGPVIGIQIENEYQHSAAPWGLTYPGQPMDMTAAERDLSVTQEGVGISDVKNSHAGSGNGHMKKLKLLAIKAGMDVPLYTATGWGNAAIIPNESLPVTAAYAYPFWTPKRDYSPFFLYKNMHRKPDYAPVRYHPEDYPAFAAELGSGIMSVYTRRPIAVHQSMDAMINRCLGSGANGIGYYMYHGGSTPRGERSFMSDEAYGLPKISYDFQAPIGEYGQVREGFHRLKLLHFFLRDFGHKLAPMTTALPANAANLRPDNITDLRYAVRIKENSGFLFLNNFQDDTAMQHQKQIQVRIKTHTGEVRIPETGGFDLPEGENAIFPFGMEMEGGIPLNYATAQLLAQCGDAALPRYVFFTPEGVKAEFSFAGNVKVSGLYGSTAVRTAKRTLVNCTDTVSVFTVATGGRKVEVLVVTKQLALKAYTVTLQQKRYLFFSDAVILQGPAGFRLLNNSNPVFDLAVYPRINTVPQVTNGSIAVTKSITPFAAYRIALPYWSFPVHARKVSEKKRVVQLPDSLPAQVNDVLLKVDYTGDTGMGFVNGELVADEFYKGLPWETGLRKFVAAGAREMVLYFRPMQPNATYLLDLQPYPQYIPAFGNAKSYLTVNGITLVPQYATRIKF